MADLYKFQAGMAQVLFGNYGDAQFDAIRAVCGGMSGVKTAKLLNFAVSCLEKDELYFEIGVLSGFTMISSGLGHGRAIVGVDNSSQFGDMKEKLAGNLKMFSHPAYQYIEVDFRKVGMSEHNKGKTGVLYIDGKHEYQEVIDAFRWAENGVLSEKSIVVLDDLSVEGVSEAIDDWMTQNRHYKTAFYLKPYCDSSTGLWSHDISIGLGAAVLIRNKKENMN